MAECEPPSFSLGFDLDFSNTPPHSPKNHVPDLIVPDSDSDHDTRPDPPHRILKRLRQGLPSVHRQTELPSFIVNAPDDDDDDIEEFSSDDEPVQVSAHSSVQNRSVCSSSKVSLKGIGVLIRHSSTNSKEKKRKQDLEIPASVGSETRQSRTVFRKITVSPLRRFQLIDEDDDVMVDEDVNGGNKPAPSTSIGPTCNQNTSVTSLKQDSKTQFDNVNRNQEDLWKHLSPVKTFPVPKDIQASGGVETGQSGSMFPNPNFEASPLRRFQLIDEDDDVMVDEDVNAGNKPGPSTSTGPTCNQNQNTSVTSLKQDSKTQFDNVNRNQEDFWKHLSPVKTFPVPKDIQASAGLETGQSGSMFPNRNLESSPLRRFQLIDSDDDDVIVIGENKPGPSSSTGNQNTRLSSLKQDRKTQFVDANQNQKHCSLVKNNYSIPTPAFNDICEEYFRSANNTQVPKSNYKETHSGVNSQCQKDKQVWEAAGPVPPAHCYYFHDDPRVQQLVRSRLCNFSPLGVNTKNQQQNIDYMGQFDNGGSTSKRSKSKNLNASEGWVDPKITSSSSRKKATKRNNTKSSVSKSKSNEANKLNSSDASANWAEPKDAGQRRVQASGQAAGHWYTGSDGRKVYVNKNGKESTGRNAYRLYRKESGAASKKSKSKTSAKKEKN